MVVKNKVFNDGKRGKRKMEKGVTLKVGLQEGPHWDKREQRWLCGYEYEGWLFSFLVRVW